MNPILFFLKENFLLDLFVFYLILTVLFFFSTTQFLGRLKNIKIYAFVLSIIFLIPFFYWLYGSDYFRTEPKLVATLSTGVLFLLSSLFAFR
ncbi:MAG: hypothetical protein AB1668_03375, partial [Nanoarchaeota archaeon]